MPVIQPDAPARRADLSSLTSSLFLCLTLAGCAHTSAEIGREEARGDRYVTSARHDLARVEYAQALANDPDNERLRAKLNESEAAYIKGAGEEVEELIKRGDLLLAMERVASLRRALATSTQGQRAQEEVSRLEEQVIASTQSAVRTAEQAHQHKRAYLLQRALSTYYPTERARVTTLDVAKAKERWIKALKETARDDEEQNLLASAALHWFKVHALTQEEAHLLRARDDQRRAVEKHPYAISIMGGGSGQQAALDEELTQALGEDHHVMLMPHVRASLEEARRDDTSAQAHPIDRLRGVELLSEGSAESGATIAVTLQDLRCDTRIEQRAKYAASTPRDVVIQRCMTTFVVELLPADGDRASRKVEELIVEEVAHDSGPPPTSKDQKVQHDIKLIDRIYARGAALISPLVEEDREEARVNLLERALTYPLERAELDARVLLYWLAPAQHARPEDIVRMREVTGFGDELVTLLNAR